MSRKAVHQAKEEQATLSFEESAAGCSSSESFFSTTVFSAPQKDTRSVSPIDEPLVLTVSELDARIREALDTNALTDILVSGEVTGYRPNASGHVYFSLTENGEKNDTSSISCVMWKYAAAKYLTFAFKDGISVRVTGYVDFYPPSGKIQLIVKRIEPASVGKTGLWLKKEEWRRELEADGVIPRPESEKRSPPLFPKSIGVVTSKTGSVLQDIRNVLARRYPLPILLSPAQVQGDGAQTSIVQALARLQGKVDVIILARGGGSFEDLFVFNHPDVVRAVRASSVPIITAIGHETDFTLADFAGDIRVPTPSAAAETVVPDRTILATTLSEYLKRISDRVRGIIRSKKTEVAELKLRIDPARLSRRLDLMHQQVADLAERIQTATVRRITSEMEDAARMRDMLHKSAYRRISTAKLELAAQKERIGANDPKKPLERGYALIRSGTTVIRSKTQLSKGDIVTVGLSDGEVTAKVEKIV